MQEGGARLRSCHSRRAVCSVQVNGEWGMEDRAGGAFVGEVAEGTNSSEGEAAARQGPSSAKWLAATGEPRSRATAGTPKIDRHHQLPRCSVSHSHRRGHGRRQALSCSRPAGQGLASREPFAAAHGLLLTQRCDHGRRPLEACFTPNLKQRLRQSPAATRGTAGEATAPSPRYGTLHHSTRPSRARPVTLQSPPAISPRSPSLTARPPPVASRQEVPRPAN